MSKPKVHGGKTNQSIGHLRRYVREVDRGEESGPPANRITVSVVAPLESRPAINYILGGLFDY